MKHMVRLPILVLLLAGLSGCGLDADGNGGVPPSGNTPAGNPPLNGQPPPAGDEPGDEPPAGWRAADR